MRRTTTNTTALGSLVLALGFAGCGQTTRHQDPPPAPVPVDIEEPVDQQSERERIQNELTATQNLSAEELLQRYPVRFSESISYTPQTATGLDLIQSSALALDSTELQTLDEHGFVITGRHSFPSFLYGYETLYLEDLPLYVSADSILHALHSSYDEILKALELSALIPDLEVMLTQMRSNLAAGSVSTLGPQVEADVDLYLTLALSLLKDTPAEPVKGADPTEIQKLFDLAKAGEGVYELALLGASRKLDFSQFTPRGHYTDLEELKRYFRSMMWLGRIDLRMIETLPDLSQVFHRRQFDASLALYGLMDSAALQRWTRIDAAIEAFVGESDNMTLHGFGRLFADLDVESLSDMPGLPDEQIADVIMKGNYGTQRISSHFMVNGVGAGTMPLSQTFLLLGQRYVLDSHVFSNVVYDRVQGGEVKRMMPDPLDAAFAALGNDQAAALLEPQLREYRYAPDLHAMRFLADAHGDEFWEANLYNLWLSALRALSPADDMPAAVQAGLPAVATTEVWGRRILKTQLASWAELRHDTILYAKQSYTSGAACEFPDAYVDPYPEFYAALQRFATRALEVVQNLESSGNDYWLDRVQEYFVTLEGVTRVLHEMAQNQRTGTPPTEDHLAFINRAVRVHTGCGSPAGAEGWFADLYFDPARGAERDPTIADVHTQPTDAAGNVVGHVLHVGTGTPELMVVSVETCNGVRAYAGLSSSYYETTTNDFDRLNDERWSQMLLETPPARVPWTTDFSLQP